MSPTRTIPLSNSSLLITVDSDMYEYFSQWKWTLKRGYAKRTRLISKDKYTTVSLHREIIPINKNEKIIFKDSNPLNCTRANLMTGTQKNVNEHKRKTKANKSGFKGVSKKRDKYIATIKHNKISYYLGSFKTDIEAAKAYNNEALKRFGVYAKLNKI